MSKVDLHVHTTASDGQLTPAQMVQLARDRGLRALGITDHDTVAGVAPALAAAETPGAAVEVIPGVEMSTDTPIGEVHILGYYVNVEDAGLLALLDRIRYARRDRAQRMVDRLAELGLRVPWQRVADLASDGAYGRPHIARVMVEEGLVSTTQEAFSRYIGYNGPAYVARYKLTPPEAVRTIRRAGGVPVLAHPAEIESLESLVADLVAEGLVGLEAYYTGYPSETVRMLVELARKYGLITTGGSDFHGFTLSSGGDLGSVDVPLWVVDDLREARLGDIDIYPSDGYNTDVRQAARRSALPLTRQASEGR